MTAARCRSAPPAPANPRCRSRRKTWSTWRRSLCCLGDDTRLRIFALLTRAELCVCEIEDILGLSQSLVSNHLAVLRRAGLVKARRDAEDSRWLSDRAHSEAAVGPSGEVPRAPGRPAGGG